MFGMGTTKHDTADALNKIDIAMFFDLIKGKIDKRQYEIITAAMAESVGPAVVGRVLKCSAEPQKRTDMLRKSIRSKVQSVTG